MAFGAAGCDADTNACTLIGCSPPLIVTVSSEADNAFAVAHTIRLELDDDVYELICEGDDCTGLSGGDGPPVGMFSGAKGVTFEVHAPTDEEPATVALEVTVEGDSVLSESVMPDYEETFPNGPDCGVCRNASVEFVLPERSVDSDTGE